MQDEFTASDQVPVTMDEFSQELSILRRDAGAPSYAEIAARIARQRRDQGISPERARIARSTVYDVFRPGRKRLDVQLIREILVALGLEVAAVEAWTELARAAQPTALAVPASAGPDTEPVPASPVRSDSQRSTGQVAMLLVACLVLNLLGRELVDTLQLELHLDMTGTAVAAIMVGPWWGALVAVATNFSGAYISGVSSIPFVLVNVAGALVWGYGVRRWGMGRTIPRFFALTLLVALVCSIVATPILVLYKGVIVHGSTTLTASLIAIAHGAVIGIFLSNLLISLVDKTISGVVALIVVESRSPGMMSGSRRSGPEPGADPAAPGSPGQSPRFSDRGRRPW